MAETDITGVQFDSAGKGGIVKLGDSGLALAATDADTDTVDAIADRVIDTRGRVDCLVNCAGVADALKPIFDQDFDCWQPVQDMSLRGSGLVTRAVGRLRIFAPVWRRDGFNVYPNASGDVNAPAMVRLISGGRITTGSILKPTPLGRSGQASEISTDLQVMCSSAASYIAGVRLRGVSDWSSGIGPQTNKIRMLSLFFQHCGKSRQNFVHLRVRQINRPQKTEIAVDQAGAGNMVCLNAGGRKPLGVPGSVIAQRIEFGGCDQGWRQAGQVRGVQQIDLGARRIVRIAQVLIEKPGHRGFGQEIAFGVVGHSGSAEAGVGGGIEQQLRHQNRPPSIARQQSRPSSQTASGTVTAHDMGALGKGTSDPVQRRHRIVDWRGKRVFWGQPVIDRNHHGAQRIGNAPTDRIMGVEISHDPATAVQIGQHTATVAHWGVDAHRNVAARSGDLCIAHCTHLFRHITITTSGHRKRLVVGARFNSRPADQRQHVPGRQAVQKCLNLRINGQNESTLCGVSQVGCHQTIDAARGVWNEIFGASQTRAIGVSVTPTAANRFYCKDMKTMCLGNKLAVISVAFRDEAARNSINNAARAPDGPDVRSPRADIPGPVGIEQPDVTLFRLSMSVNTVRAVIDTGQPVASMGNRGNGSIIFFASVPELTKSLAQTLAREKSRVNTDCLGLPETPMAFEFTSRNGDPIEAAANQYMMIAAIPIKPLGRLPEMNHAALWLASGETPFCPGVALPAGGGFPAQQRPDTPANFWRILICPV